MQQAWVAPPRNWHLVNAVEGTSTGSPAHVELESMEKKPSLPSPALTLLHRSFIKSYRDVVAYGIRLASVSWVSPTSVLLKAFGC